MIVNVLMEFALPYRALKATMEVKFVENIYTKNIQKYFT